jgi:virulence factor Mce-like protein
METRRPSPARIATMALFALSCVGLLLYLWISFGGAVPLQPKGWRFKVGFEQAAQLADQAEVRVAGVPVGKVVALDRQPGSNRTDATIEMDPRYAPIAIDSRAMLRTKSLLGETYVEMTLGHRGSPMLREGARLPNRQVTRSVQLDEILDSLDPYTRRAFRTWQQELGRGVAARGQDLNDSFGHLPSFVTEGGDLSAVLDRQEAAVRGLVRNSGVVFGALAEHGSQLTDLIADSDTIFAAIARQRDGWAETWRVMPTFLTESRLTLDRLDRFAADTEPLLRELTPAVEDLAPSLRALGRLSPDLRRFFLRLGPLITISKRALPALREIVVNLQPVLRSLGPWLSELNPIVAWVGEDEATLSDFLAQFGFAVAPKTPTANGAGVGHYLKQIAPSGPETVAMWPKRLATNRGNAYINPGEMLVPELGRDGILTSWDCANAGGEKGVDSTAACRVQKPYPFGGRIDRFPQVRRADYSNP